MKRKQLHSSLKVIGVFLFILFLSTCDVGLGESIDTTVPEVSIDEPKAGTIVSGHFDFSGTAKDDGVISNVEVTFKGLGTTTSEYVFNSNSANSNGVKVELSNEKWNLAIDSTGNSGVADGTYSLSVKISLEFPQPRVPFGCQSGSEPYAGTHP